MLLRWPEKKRPHGGVHVGDKAVIRQTGLHIARAAACEQTICLNHPSVCSPRNTLPERAREANYLVFTSLPSTGLK